jgi:hypothetical protein
LTLNTDTILDRAPRTLGRIVRPTRGCHAIADRTGDAAGGEGPSANRCASNPFITDVVSVSEILVRRTDDARKFSSLTTRDIPPLF